MQRNGGHCGGQRSRCWCRDCCRCRGRGREPQIQVPRVPERAERGGCRYEGTPHCASRAGGGSGERADSLLTDFTRRVLARPSTVNAAEAAGKQRRPNGLSRAAEGRRSRRCARPALLPVPRSRKPGTAQGEYSPGPARQHGCARPARAHWPRSFQVRWGVGTNRYSTVYKSIPW